MHPSIAIVAAYAWRLLAIAAAAGVTLWVLGRIRPVVLALVIAALVSRVLAPVSGWLRRHGLPEAMAAAVSILGFVLVIALTFGFVGVAVAGEGDQLGTAVETAVDDIERWLVEDSPFEIRRQDLRELRVDAGEAVRGISAAGPLASGALVAIEAAVALLLGLIVAFFVLKDGPRIVASGPDRLGIDRAVRVERLARRAWQALGGYLRGAAILGLVEGLIVGVSLKLLGAKLAVPVAALTFVGAFVPVVGAVLAGALAVLVTLATAGLGQALAMALIALVVQQLDNDLLAPVIYGRQLSLHPVAILLAIAAGGSAFGLVGTVLAVPVLAVTVNVLDEARVLRREAQTAE